MNKFLFVFAAFFLTVASTAGITQEKKAPSKPASRPNVVIILLDDMGFSDPGCFGGEVHTPNMDKLARNGLRFTRFYNGTRCSPTRASLLTGQYPHRVNMGDNNNNLGRNGVTLAEVLGADGYETAMVGKWHLAKFGKRGNWDGRSDEYMAWLNNQIDGDVPYSPRDAWPVRRGFDRFYGVIWGVVNYFNPFSLAEGMQPIRDIPEDYYFTDAISERAVKYVRDMSKTDRPFFLYMAHTAPHWPLHAPEETIEKYSGVYRDGWHELRRERYERQLEMGLISDETHPLPELMGRGKDWQELSEARRAYEARKMAVHAAMVDRGDQGIGRVLDALKQTEELDNTLIFVLSDNGASPEEPGRPGFDRPSELQDGRNIRYADRVPIEEVGSATSFPSIGAYWANASNTPFRYWKAESYQGGHHTPLIAHWPDGIDRKDGAITRRKGHVMDLFATVLDVSNTAYPDPFQGREIAPMDGKSLLPVLNGNDRTGHRTLFFEHEGGKAVIGGGWKAVQPRRGSNWELYHFAEERTEITDRSEQRPERLQNLKRKWLSWYRRMKFSEKNTFVLEKGANLNRQAAPYVKEVPFTIFTRFQGGEDSGVIVAHGGRQFGYALYVVDGTLRFGFRNSGSLREYELGETHAKRGNRASVRLTRDGRLILSLNGRKTGTKQVSSLLSRMPKDGLQVGRDLRSNVGSYGGEATYSGAIDRVRIERTE